MNIAKQLEQMLKDYARELSQELEFEGVEAYAQERIAHLASIRTQPGYSLAVGAEAINVLAKTSLTAVDAADATDAKLLAFLRGALAMAVEALKLA